MFRAKTVLVIGAGASVEVGLPMGPELLRRIAELVHFSFDYNELKKGDHSIYNALKIIINGEGNSKKLKEHTLAGRQLGESARQALSIDNVIDALEDPSIELVGKLGIVRAILAAENTSSNFKPVNNYDNTLDLGKFNDTWYSSLTKILTENIKKSSIDDVFQNLEIVNFNYDRCLEHYLPISLASYYGLSQEATRNVMQTLPIHRPYGVAGRLPWQVGSAPSVPFGDCTPQQLASVVQQVRTFTERVEEGEELAAMRKAIAQADRVIFLGFAFHRQNVELLSQTMQEHSEILATAYGISQSDKSVIDNELAKAFDYQLQIHDTRIELASMTCHQLFQQYWRTITAEKGDHENYSMPSYDMR